MYLYSDRRLEAGVAYTGSHINRANVVFTNLIFIDDAIVVHSKHQINLNNSYIYFHVTILYFSFLSLSPSLSLLFLFVMKLFVAFLTIV